MENEYDAITSNFYLQYRPPLHQIILDKCLTKNDQFNYGLDYGCGTGNSSIALERYCKKIIGVDPSNDMLDKAIRNPNIEYQLLKSVVLDVENNFFEIVTLAGSLYYAKSQHLLDELIRVCKNNALVVVYDFQIDLKPVMSFLEKNYNQLIEGNYNHEENFSGLETSKINLKHSNKENIKLEIINSNLVKLLLSSKDNYQVLSQKYGLENLETQLNFILDNSSIQYGEEINSTIYYSIYEVIKRVT